MKKKRGAQLGNQNARGHGAPKGNQNAKGHGAPFGNCNAVQHGKYSIFKNRYNRELRLAALNYMEKNHIKITYENMEICSDILYNLSKVRQKATAKDMFNSAIYRTVRDFGTFLSKSTDKSM